MKLKIEGKLRDVPKYEGYYSIDKDSNIVSLDRKIPNSIGNGFRVMKGKTMTKTIGSHGYYSVMLTKNGKSKPLLIHRMLAEIFIDNPDNKPCVNHKDGNKLNNKLDNLEWCTYKENSNHAWKLGLHQPPLWSQESRDKISLAHKGKLRGLHNDDKYIITCEHCGNKKTTYKYKTVKYCSRECADKARIGQPARNPYGRKGKNNKTI